jgi:TldD protein
VKDLCEAALDAALAAGASYADVRVVERRTQGVSTRNGEIERVSDAETAGVGVRVLASGAWGFACDGSLGVRGASAAARRAVAFALASGSRGRTAVVLAPVDAAHGEYRTPARRDPVDVPLEEKIALCLRAEAGLTGKDVAVRQATVRAMRERRWLRTSVGTDTFHEIVECGGAVHAHASLNGLTQSRSYPGLYEGLSAQSGWEFVEGLDLPGQAPRVAEEAGALVHADACPAGVTTVVLDAELMQSQLHESIGHPTELDRIYGMEAAYAGTSFVQPPDVGTLKYGSPLLNVTADPTTTGGLGTFAFDDEGVPARPEPIVRDGILVGALSSRETAVMLGLGVGGSMRGDGWSRMPLVRMTNLHLEPGEGTLDELIDGVDDGIYLGTCRSWSIDDKRLNFQFGAQIAREIRRGRLGRLLRDATYTGVTPEFWRSLDGVAGPSEWRLHGITSCGKGQPGQYGHVTHGTAPARFRNVQVRPA